MGNAIREAERDDIDEVQEVAHRSWEDTYADILGKEEIDETVEDWYSTETLEDAIRMPDSSFLVYEEDSEIGGFSHAVVNGDEADLLRLYVDPDHRRKGIGTRLLHEIRERLSDLGVERLKVFVLADNQVGNSFYQSLGFEKDDTNETEIEGEPYEENVYVIEVEE
ncbi:N-acetyltransferase family protein [Halorutilales archaeon Cl-col2-1]